MEFVLHLEQKNVELIHFLVCLSLAKSSNLSGRKFKCIDKDKYLNEKEELENLCIKYKEERGLHSALIAILEAVADVFIGLSKIFQNSYSSKYFSLDVSDEVKVFVNSTLLVPKFYHASIWSFNSTLSKSTEIKPTLIYKKPQIFNFPNPLYYLIFFLRV